MAKKIFFFYDTLTRYLISFMSIWKKLYIQTTYDGKPVLYNIPVVYGQFDKYQEIRKFIEEKGRNFLSGYSNTPIISIIDNGFEFDESRDPANKNNVNIHHSDANDLYLKNRIPIPVNYKFQMKIWTTFLNHKSQLSDQLFPYIWRPFTLKLLEFPNIQDIKRSVVCEVPNKSVDDSYEDETEPNNSALKKRIMTIDFVVKGQMYFPVSNDDGFIKKIKVQYENGKTGDEFGTQVVEGINEFIDYLELLKIQEIKANGGFELENEDGVNTLNQYIRADDYLFSTDNAKDILDLMAENTTISEDDYE